MIQENGGKLDIKALQNLSYLDTYVEEALRLCPSVFLTSRKSKKDIKLRN